MVLVYILIFLNRTVALNPASVDAKPLFVFFSWLLSFGENILNLMWSTYRLECLQNRSPSQISSWFNVAVSETLPKATHPRNALRNPLTNSNVTLNYELIRLPCEALIYSRLTPTSLESHPTYLTSRCFSRPPQQTNTKIQSNMPRAERARKRSASVYVCYG